jgi:hypothetical protein
MTHIYTQIKIINYDIYIYTHTINKCINNEKIFHQPEMENTKKNDTGSPLHACRYRLSEAEK